jgi:type IV fimbrial biogenesis protein FimT
MRARGFTLLEALVALTVASILIGLAVPPLSGMLAKQQLSRATLDISRALTQARHESIMRSRPVLVDNRDGQWSSGWQIFVDDNWNGIRDSGEPLIRVGEIPSGVRVVGNTPVRRYVRYTPSGRALMLSGAFQAGTITLCHQNGNLSVKRVVLAATGRVRTETGTALTC